jgi:hypothetical protein
MRYMPVIGDYQDVVGPMRAIAHGVDESQKGAPHKAVDAI